MLAGLEAADGILRRKTVGETTLKMYLRLADEFLTDQRLSTQSPLPMVDRRLEQELDQLYLAGEGTAPGRNLFYALRWAFSAKTEDFPKASAARLGHSRIQKPSLQEPETWEATVLMAHALVSEASLEATPAERGLAAAGVLLSFDLYGRANDLAKALKAELRPPVASQPGAAGIWTLTLYPTTQQETSKTRTQDETVAIGTSNKRRLWLRQLCRPLTLHSPSDKRLLCMTPKRYLQLFHLGRRLAHLAPSNPHRLRHGGASADGLLTSGEQLSDLEIASRGRSRSMKSIRRYRQPARYLRQLQLLLKPQLLLAKAVESKLPRLIQTLLAGKSK